MSQKPNPLRVVTDSSRNPSRIRESKPSSAEIAELVAQAGAGERDAFDELVRVTHGDAYGLAFRLTGNQEDAQDVVQDAYLRAYRGLAAFRGDAQFSTWLYRIVANTASTHTTRRRRHRLRSLDEPEFTDHMADLEADQYYAPDKQAEGADLRDRIKSAVAQLPPRLRSVVVLRDMYDLPHDAIAEELGISVSAAKVRLHRARHRLRDHVFGDQEGRDDD